MVLNLRWVRLEDLLGSEWHRSELALQQSSFNENWNGRFRRVKIAVTMKECITGRLDGGGETLQMMKQTEVIEKRFVGENAEVVHSEISPEDNPWVGD